MRGLTNEEVVKRIGKFGKNVLPEKPPPSQISIFISQFKSPLVYVLFVAGFISLFLKDFEGSIIIFLAVIVNSIFGYVQESKASKTLTSLRKFITHDVEVLRDGIRLKVNTEELVPGDILYLHQGTKVPADGHIIEVNRLYVDEAIITGESLPVQKELFREFNEEGKVYMGTVVSSGFGLMEVESTGKNTKIGEIAVDIQEIKEETPLKRQLIKFSNQLVGIVVGLTVFVFLLGVVTQKDVVEMLTISSALAVSAIPESLLIGLTVVLSIGMQRILKRRGLVRKLTSAETLGGVTTICLDKTGTLTKGKFEIVDILGKVKDVSLQMIAANDLDDPIVIKAHDWALNHGSESEILSKYPKLDNLPFSAKDRFSASLNMWDKKSNMLFVNGAPDYLLKWSVLSEREKEKILEVIEKFTSDGKRVIGLARKKVSKSLAKIVNPDFVKKDLEWVGLMTFIDPIRIGVAESLNLAKKAGIKLIVITGDYPKTAMSVMAELGMKVNEDQVITGDALNITSPDKLKEIITKIKLFARTTPEQKLMIIDALKSSGEIVAMMGDGVNDAPALNKADIGIVVGDATDVAKESADLVLLDSEFKTVVAAIEEGRGIYDNLRKIIMYLMSAAFNEIITVVSALFIGLPLPITTGQILWINLVSDGFPNIALTIDPKHKGLMASSPRSPNEPLVTGWMKTLILIVSFTSGILSLLLFTYIYKVTNDLAKARSIAFVSLGINSLIYSFSIRTLTRPFWRDSIFANMWLVYAVMAGFVLQLTPFFFQKTRDFFGIVTFSSVYWYWIVASGLITFGIIEISKVIFKARKFKYI